jgi:hypothetical protein
MVRLSVQPQIYYEIEQFIVFDRIGENIFVEVALTSGIGYIGEADRIT